MTLVIEIWIICDRCFQGIETGCFDEEEAQQYVDKNGWITDGEKHYHSICYDEMKERNNKENRHE